MPCRCSAVELEVGVAESLAECGLGCNLKRMGHTKAQKCKQERRVSDKIEGKSFISHGSEIRCGKATVLDYVCGATYRDRWSPPAP